MCADLDFIKTAIVAVAAVVRAVCDGTFNAHICSFSAHNNFSPFSFFKALPYDVIIYTKSSIIQNVFNIFCLFDNVLRTRRFKLLAAAITP